MPEDHQDRIAELRRRLTTCVPSARFFFERLLAQSIAREDHEAELRALAQEHRAVTEQLAHYRALILQHQLGPESDAWRRHTRLAARLVSIRERSLEL